MGSRARCAWAALCLVAVVALHVPVPRRLRLCWLDWFVRLEWRLHLHPACGGWVVPQAHALHAKQAAPPSPPLLAPQGEHAAKEAGSLLRTNMMVVAVQRHMPLILDSASGSVWAIPLALSSLEE